MAEEPQNHHACIDVIAGVNGSGKSTTLGATLVMKGSPYFNPDEWAQRVLAANPHITQEAANSMAWHQGKRLLEEALAYRLDFAFETTLGGHTITHLLGSALDAGVEVRMQYVGLSSPELHIARMHSRVAKGGHPIPEGKIRERYNTSRSNLILLMPKLTDLKVYDNSKEADPFDNRQPEPKLILHMARGKILSCCELTNTPDWAKPIVASALKLSGVHL